MSFLFFEMLFMLFALFFLDSFFKRYKRYKGSESGICLSIYHLSEFKSQFILSLTDTLSGRRINCLYIRCWMMSIGWIRYGRKISLPLMMTVIHQVWYFSIGCDRRAWESEFWTNATGNSYFLMSSGNLAQAPFPRLTFSERRSFGYFSSYFFGTNLAERQYN